MKSNIHGEGIFTTKSITKGQSFYEVPMKIFSNAPKPNWAYIGNEKWISDENVLNFVNHSCDPNSILETGEHPKLTAVRDIDVWNEITVDYNQTEEGGKKVPCKCKSKNCSGYFLRIE